MNNIGLLILRVTFSALMMMHGIPKFLKLVSGDFSFSDPIGMGSMPTLILFILAEIIAPVLIIIGWKTKWFAIPVVATTAITAFVIQANSAIQDKQIPLLFLFGFITIALVGAGQYSMDKS